MSSFITQCPHCETSFNITQAQLQLAKGKVRCGFCLQVFSALEQQLFFEDEELENTENEELGNPDPQSDLSDYYAFLEQTNERAKQRYSGILNEEKDDSITSEVEEDEVDETDLEHLENDLGDENLPEDQTEEEVESILSSEETDEEHGEHKEYEEIEDESDIDESTDAILEAQTEEPLDGDYPEEDHTEEVETALAEHDTEDEHEITDNEEAPTETEPEEDQEDLDSLAEESAPVENLAAEPEPEITDKADHGTQSSTPDQANKRKTELQSLESLYAEDSLNADGEDTLHTISEEPIPIYRQDERPAFVTALLILANILLISTLAAQYAWENIDTYIRNQRFTALTDLVCDYADCPAVERFDLSLFSTDQLLVNSHPSIADALQIDFIFRNSADFEQVFPMVELNFSDLNRRLVANRLFSPDEYLDPELQQFTHLPANSSIQVRLEISDPGPAAINYSLALRMP
jgi:predicted Zn finger-like uncharacterized protein